MQNRMFFVLLRPILCEKWKIAPPPIQKQPPSNVWICEIGRNISVNFGEDFFFFFYFGDHLILGGKNLWISDFGRKITLNFGEDLFFWRSPNFGRKKPLNFRAFRNISSQLSDWNWFKINENSSQGRLHTSHSFKIAPPLFQILATRLLCTRAKCDPMRLK